jgi:dihydropteroate synthase
MANDLLIKNRLFRWGSRTYIMGILNLTPDSFSGDGLGTNLETIIRQARKFYAEGADMLDIGGESTNPYHSEPVSLEEEMQRVIPAIRAISGEIPLPISIDTCKPQVAQAALENGADIINDIHGLEDAAMQILAARTGIPVIAMHMRGTPRTMQSLTDYGGDVAGELLQYFREQTRTLITAGIEPHKIIIDPGFGFAKTYEQNLELLDRLNEFKALGFPVLAGVSRKGFVGRSMVAEGTPPPPPGERLWGTAAAVAIAIARSADIVRVHDVAEMAAVSRVADAVTRR